VPTTTVHTYRVPVREGKDGTEYTLERTFRSLEDAELVGGWLWGSGR